MSPDSCLDWPFRRPFPLSQTPFYTTNPSSSMVKLRRAAPGLALYGPPFFSAPSPRDRLLFLRGPPGHYLPPAVVMLPLSNLLGPGLQTAPPSPLFSHGRASSAFFFLTPPFPVPYYIDTLKPPSPPEGRLRVPRAIQLALKRAVSRRCDPFSSILTGPPPKLAALREENE